MLSAMPCCAVDCPLSLSSSGRLGQLTCPLGPLGLQESDHLCTVLEAFMCPIKWGLTKAIDQVHLGTSLDQKGGGLKTTMICSDMKSRA